MTGTASAHDFGKGVEKLAKALGTTVAEVVECHHIIQRLEPKPGRNFDEGDTRYIVPDVYIVKVGEDFQVVLNDEGHHCWRPKPRA